ncbi:FAD/NAD(P)-dependent oxidoreductase [Azospirillum picis]|uniref:NADPH-dependent 2,4-dienoyl-CoA reductase/sulfur reductase-like enzyme n=1 Tax=Azospirillum picis TaxID=488438 RepID=A0ABU0MND8_9PROT|nr:NAD(P)/FAD-dependent oxidoreductase [Azospirillum picis]MBP2301193.1 NADPH-dependent 2,4-dienoyl-CoA reductase/sulfur reductase-like enzyme [Azospirillum picis]MDQ0534844.1 NADPH-dependent 2,4-dienoyl-CoA reductase/sulfur reductase-like enzyme [Azospirillum picis]
MTAELPTAKLPTAELPPVIVGAGPAGIRAAERLVAAGLRPVVVDEAARWGGQIYRQPPEAGGPGGGFTRPKSALYGFEAGKADAVHRAMAAIRDRVDYRPRTLAWNCEAGALDLLCDGESLVQPFSRLILATGATDRVLPFPGWTLPGVFTLGGSQVALKFQGCAVGRRVAFLGTGPLLYLVAYQYLKAGVEVAGVFDTTPFAVQARAMAGMLRDPSTLAKGLLFVGWLRAHGVPVHNGVRPLRAEGTERVEALAWRYADGREHRVSCDAVAFGLGLRSETQLADLAGCRFRFDAADRAWLPERDGAGRSSVAGVYLAGDGGGIAGADAAELAGERAAFALLEDLGRPVDAARVRELDRRLGGIATFRRSLNAAFPFPADWAATVADDTMICRCEGVTAGALRGVARSGQAREINRAKALTRTGMGRCQGRMCGATAAELLAQALGTGPDGVGRLRAQPPIKPLPVAATPSPLAGARSGREVA